MPIIASRRYQGGQPSEKSLPVDGGARGVLPEGSFDWVGLANPTPEELEPVRQQFGLHSLAVEDALNPVQISAAGMDPAELKERFGERLTFWGGAIDAQHVLARESPETVRQHVRRHLAIWKRGGGYVFNNVHNIQAGVSPENITALFDAAYECGFYG